MSTYACNDVMLREWTNLAPQSYASVDEDSTARIMRGLRFGTGTSIHIEAYDTAEAQVQQLVELTNGRGTDIVME